MTLRKLSFENIVGNGENAGNKHFLLFLQYFLPLPTQISIFPLTFILSSASAFNLGASTKILFGKELKLFVEKIISLATMDSVQSNHDLHSLQKVSGCHFALLKRREQQNASIMLKVVA